MSEKLKQIRMKSPDAYQLPQAYLRWYKNTRKTNFMHTHTHEN